MSADQSTKTFVLKGVGVSPGIAIGRCYRFDPLGSQISFYKLKDESLVPKEVQRFRKALKESEEQLVETIQNTYRNLQLITFKPSFWAGATWYWLVPNKHLGLFAKATISSGEVPMKLRSWALPFKE